MMRLSSPLARRAATAFALFAAVSLTAGDAFARAGGGKSSGSRGSFSRQAPPATDTAPRQAQPLPSPGMAQPSAAARPGMAGAAQAAQPSRMRSMMTGLAAGFLGAGLFGLLSGSGFFSGMGSLLGILGMIVQVALVFFIVRWAINMFRNRKAAVAAGPSPGLERQAMGAAPQAAAMAGGSMGLNSVPGRGEVAPLQIEERDFNAFERLLVEIQDAYSRADRTALNVRATPEMAAMFVHDIDEDEKRGIRNQINGVKLLQGDLAEAWRENGAEFATVAMRYAINDTKIDRASGRVIEGGPEEVTELWTFIRRPGETSEGWKLSAIQQA